MPVNGFIPPDVGDDDHLVRRLGWALVSQWKTLPADVQGRLKEQAIFVHDKDTTSLPEQINAFLKRHAEVGNLTMRMHNRRFTRLTNAFSKKFENHAHMVAIYAVWYNWLRIHKTLRITPAMAARLSKTVMDWTDIVEMMDADMPATKRGPYKKQTAI
jgi:hypothetical protein